MTFKKVLIPIDESAFAAHAADVGTDLATQLGAEVAFVTVVDAATTFYTADSGVPADEWLAVMKRDAKTLLNAFASRKQLPLRHFSSWRRVNLQRRSLMQPRIGPPI